MVIKSLSAKTKQQTILSQKNSNRLSKINSQSFSKKEKEREKWRKEWKGWNKERDER